MDVKMPDGTIIKNVPEGMTQADVMRLYEAHVKSTGGPKPAGEITSGRVLESFAQNLAKYGPGTISQGLSAARAIVAPRGEEKEMGLFDRAGYAAEQQGKFVESLLGPKVTPTGPAEELAATTGKALAIPATTIGPGMAMRALPGVAPVGRVLSAQPFSQIASSVLGEAGEKTGGPLVGGAAGLLGGYLAPGAGSKVVSLMRRPYAGLSAGEKSARQAIESIAKRANYTTDALLAELERQGPNGTLANIPEFREQLVMTLRKPTETGERAGEQLLPRLEESAERQGRRLTQTISRGERGGAAATESGLLREIETTRSGMVDKAKKFFTDRFTARPTRVQRELASYGPVVDTEQLKYMMQTQRENLNKQARETFLQKPVADLTAINDTLRQSDTARTIYNKIIDQYRKEGKYAPVLPDDPRPAQAALSLYNQQRNQFGEQVANQWFVQRYPGKTIAGLQEEALGTKGLTQDLADRVSRAIGASGQKALDATGLEKAMREGMVPVINDIKKDWDAALRVLDKNPEYVKWKAGLSRLEDLEDKVEKGAEAAAKNYSPDRIGPLLVGANDEQKRALRLGYSRELSNMLGRGSNEFAKLADNRTAQETARRILGDEPADKFWSFLNTEKKAADIDKRFVDERDPKRLADLSATYAPEWGGAKQAASVATNERRIDALNRGRKFFSDKETTGTLHEYLSGLSSFDRRAFEQGVLEGMLADPAKYAAQFSGRQGPEYQKYAMLFGEPAAQTLADEARRYQQFGTTLEQGQRAMGKAGALDPTTIERTVSAAEPAAKSAVGFKTPFISWLGRFFESPKPVVTLPEARVPFGQILTDPAASRQAVEGLQLPESIVPGTRKLIQAVTPGMPVATGVGTGIQSEEQPPQ
jgi:hypothetical protein